MPKSAAAAETPQCPELRLQGHRTQGLGAGVGRLPGWAWHPPLSSLISATGSPCYPLSFRPSSGHHTPEWPQRQPQITAYTSDKRGLLASRKGLGGLGWGGGPFSPSCRSRGTKGPERRGWLPIPPPCPQQLLVQVLQVCLRGESCQYTLVQGGKGWRRHLRPQVEIAALSRTGPERAPGWERGPLLYLPFSR